MKKIALLLLLVWTLSPVVAANSAPENPFAVGLSLNTTLNKFGVGARFSYSFTPMVRLVGDISYYPWGPNSTRVYQLGGDSHGIFQTHSIPASTPFTNIYSGRYVDVNANVNILFGKQNFHFYLIGGLGYVYGIPHLASLSHHHVDEVTGENLGDGLDSKEEIFHSNIGFNLGVGFEYQLKPAWRIFAELEGSVGYGLILNAAAIKLGASYCF